MDVIDKIIRAKEFATLPSVATRVLRMLENDNIDANSLNSVIEKDPSLTLRILKVANSPIYGARREINTVQHAIMLIGFRKLAQVVLGVSIFSKFWLASTKGAMDLMNKFWWHSSSTGTVAKTLTDKINRSFQENEFIGGLLHQIGKLAMLQFDIEKYMKVIDLVTNNEMLDEEAEKEVFGVSHLQVGDSIAELWKLPDEIRTIIANYNDPQSLSDHRDLVATVNLANLLSEINGADFYKGIKIDDIRNIDSYKILMESCEPLRSNGEDFFELNWEEEFQKTSEFLSAIKS